MKLKIKEEHFYSNSVQRMTSWLSKNQLLEVVWDIHDLTIVRVASRNFGIEQWEVNDEGTLYDNMDILSERVHL